MTTAAVNDAVTAALKEQPQAPSNLINVAGRQRIRFFFLHNACVHLLGLGPIRMITQQRIIAHSETQGQLKKVKRADAYPWRLLEIICRAIVDIRL